MCFLSYKVRNVFSSQVRGFWKWKYVYQLILYSSDGLLKLKVCLSIYSIFEWWAIEIESMSINLFSTQVMGYWNWKYVYQFILHSSDVPLKLKVCLSIDSLLKWWAVEIESMSINLFYTRVMGHWNWKYVYQFILHSSDGRLKNDSMSINLFTTQVMGYWKWKFVYQFILHSSDGLLKMKACISIYSTLKWRAIENESTSINVFSTQVVGYWKWKYVIILFSTQVMGYWKWKYVYQFILHSSDVLLKGKVISVYSNNIRIVDSF